MDLTQVEGIKDLINAETESQRRVALQATAVGHSFPFGIDCSEMSILKGQVRDWLSELRTDIIKCLGYVEALIDFSEEDIEDGILDDGQDLRAIFHDRDEFHGYF